MKIKCMKYYWSRSPHVIVFTCEEDGEKCQGVIDVLEGKGYICREVREEW